MSAYIKELTNNLIDIDKNQFRIIIESIHKQKNILNSLIQRSKQIRTQIQTENSQLLSISEKISQSKNFLSIMECRLPAEKEDQLLQILNSNQKSLEEKQYKNEREKNDILTVVKDASMKLEAIKAVRVTRDQLSSFGRNSEDTNKSLKMLGEEQQTVQMRIAETSKIIEKLFDSKRNLSADRQKYLDQYNKTTILLDKINTRLNLMAEMRQRQRQEYGHGLPNDALFKVKETAKKKLESGSKLSFEELKLLYSENV
jgi:uncharacterized coiled-coil DUF342 family protein